MEVNRILAQRSRAGTHTDLNRQAPEREQVQEREQKHCKAAALQNTAAQAHRGVLTAEGTDLSASIEALPESTEALPESIEALQSYIEALQVSIAARLASIGAPRYREALRNTGASENSGAHCTAGQRPGPEGRAGSRQELAGKSVEELVGE